MPKTDTQYVVVSSNGLAADKVAKLLDDGYTLIASWVAGTEVHHLLSKGED